VRSGGAAANALIDRNIDLPVLVHSHNHWGAADMTRRLKGAGFDVVTVRYENLTEDFFRECLVPRSLPSSIPPTFPGTCRETRRFAVSHPA